MSPNLKCHFNRNVTKNKMSPKLKCHQTQCVYIVQLVVIVGDQEYRLYLLAHCQCVRSRVYSISPRTCFVFFFKSSLYILSHWLCGKSRDQTLFKSIMFVWKICFSGKIEKEQNINVQFRFCKYNDILPLNQYTFLQIIYQTIVD